MKKFIYLLLTLSCILFSNNKSFSIISQPKATQILSKMTLKEKVGQLFIICPEALNIQPSNNQIKENAKQLNITDVTEQMNQVLHDYPTGGIILFKENIISPSQLCNFISKMQQSSPFPLFTAIDEEGGRVARIANSNNFNVPKYESIESIGNTNNSDNAYNVGVSIGTYLKQYGLNLNFAPIADINTNPNNIVIGNRSFGKDPNLVSNMVISEIHGLHHAGIITCIKHFPGHGDTTQDTHSGYVSISKSWNQLMSCELIPFINSLPFTDLVMISHITLPNITTDNLPSSLSHQLITDKLRTELGYNGVVITDALNMKAIKQNYTCSDAAVKSILAGIDIILMPENYQEAFNSILSAVNSGIISESRINESVLRILTLKEKYHLI